MVIFYPLIDGGIQQLNSMFSQLFVRERKTADEVDSDEHKAGEN
jgi:hypothetical protein